MLPLKTSPKTSIQILALNFNINRSIKPSI